MFFIIFGFLFIILGLDLVKLDMWFGLEWVVYVLLIIIVVILVGWLVVLMVYLRLVNFVVLLLNEW